MEQLVDATTDAVAAIALGDRVRQLRIGRGLTQTDLAGERFTKEYVSQIERGKTRPTEQTLGWLAERLGTDADFLRSGVSATARDRDEAVIARAEAAIERQDHETAVAELAGWEEATEAQHPTVAVRGLLALAWARMHLGELRPALALLGRARELAERPDGSDVERAEVLYRLGVCRYKLSSITTAIGLLTQALELAQRSPIPSDRLRAHVLEWRSRCYRRQRDWEAAREDVELALELADALDDEETRAHVLFQASLIAERNGQWILARSYAEQARALYEQIEDRANVGRLLNNLGGLSFLLGNADQAKGYLKDAFRVALDVGSDTDAAHAVSSLAQVHLRTGESAVAEDQARRALDLLAGREDHLDEIGNAQLVLARSLLDQDRLDEAERSFHDAETTLAQLSSVSHRAAAWVGLGDVASRRGDQGEAARLYRRAAEALQDFRF
ncbi:MAG: tetratricopeptide repeat protein [Thermoleophilia bacterium]